MIFIKVVSLSNTLPVKRADYGSFLFAPYLRSWDSRPIPT